MTVVSYSKLFGALLVAAVGQAHGSICALANTQFGLLPYFVERHPNADYVTEIKADFDGDGKKDVLSWFPQEAGSAIPADYASVWLTLSSSSEPFTLVETYVNVLMYRNRYYVITTNVADERQQGRTTVYSVVRSGFRRLCSIAEAEPARR